ncbi:hypothetical protein [Mesorhizobium sp.]|uniref:hypothetical protein n=1 Tax=Mesorhizobium sp. TaxID=1871066 RepID=UPI001202C2E4|nr:hypothetical protein [Mesorhizobium sp.]TIQ46744.1 MAG: hypothetical protein E5X47_23405 [Mesorhizobium sp.]TIQ56517.1 MAG: hypothetical protein E5X46_18770 [Mesorhizobium sp.]
MTRLKASESKASSPSSGADDSRSDQFADAIRVLLSALSPQEQDQVLRKVIEKLRPIPAPRAGEVLEAIVLALPQRRDWSVEELRKTVQQQGVSATPKEVSNAIGYLTRKRHMRRVGYGRYVVDGTEIVTSDDLGGENARHEDLYRVERE